MFSPRMTKKKGVKSMVLLKLFIQANTNNIYYMYTGYRIYLSIYDNNVTKESKRN